MKWLIVLAFSGGLASCDGAESPTPDAALPGLADAEVDAALPDAALPDAAPLDAAPPSGPLDDVLRLNHIQARGTHNSYHQLPDPVLHPSHRYQQAPLDVQLGAQGVRQLELDVHARSDGGFDVLHLPLIDPETSCLALEDCLRTLVGWSDAHPGHLPVLIWFEPKDEGVGGPAGYVRSIDRMGALEAAVAAVVPVRRIFTPDLLRRGHRTLPESLAAEGWPTLGEVRGRFIFALLDRGAHRAAYLAEPAGPAGHLIFVTTDGPEDPNAAIFKLDNPGSPEAVARVAEGFLVTSNVDSAEDTPEANAARRALALANGVHFLSSDFPAPSSPEDANWLAIPGGTPARCNPVTAPAVCDAAALEPQ